MKEAIDKYAETLKSVVPVIQSVSRVMRVGLDSLQTLVVICSVCVCVCPLWSGLQGDLNVCPRNNPLG